MARFAGDFGGGRLARLPVTYALCAILIVVSVASALAERFHFMTTDLWAFDALAILQGEVWRLLTYAFVESEPVSLIFSAAMIFLCGRSCEPAWGSRDFLRFFLLSSIGAATLALPLIFLINYTGVFTDPGHTEGPNAFILALLVGLMLREPDAKVLFGFILPVSAKASVALVVALYVLTGLMSGSSPLATTLGGAAMGYVLTTGIWRPRIWARHWRGRRTQKRRDGLYVVRPPRDKKHWLN